MILGWRWRRAVARVWATGALVAFVATGPGTAGVEVVFHLAGGGSSDHSLGVHLEQAGADAHADHCQLGQTASHGRLPVRGDVRLREAAAQPHALPLAAEPLPAERLYLPKFPRAPPVRD